MLFPKIPPGVRANDLTLDTWLRQYGEPGARRSRPVTHTFGGAANVVERIRHRLGAVPTGWRVLEQSAAGSVYRDAATPAPDRFFLYLKSPAAGLRVVLEVT